MSEKYSIFRAFGSRKFLALFRQKSDLESLFTRKFTWCLKESVSSKRTPRSLYDLWSAAGWESKIRPRGVIRAGSLGFPNSFSSKTMLLSSKFSIFLPFVWKIKYLVFEIFTAILFALNQLASLLISEFIFRNTRANP